MEAPYLATAAVILLAIIALILWRIERHLRPETYVLMRWDAKKWTWTGRGRMVPAEPFGTAYITEQAAWREARLFHEDARLLDYEEETIYIIEKKRGALIGRVTGVPSPTAVGEGDEEDEQ
jgi:hypothetical protein